MEWRQENAAIQGVKMKETLQLKIRRRGGFAAIARRLGGESIFGAGAGLLDVPGEVRGADVFGYAVGEALGQRNHFCKGAGSQDVLKRGAHGGQRERVPGQRAADAAHVAVFELNARGNAPRLLR